MESTTQIMLVKTTMAARKIVSGNKLHIIMGRMAEINETNNITPRTSFTYFLTGSDTISFKRISLATNSMANIANCII